jgi:glucokinase
MDHTIQPTAPKATPQILLQRTSVKSVCCTIFFLVSDTWEWSASALEGVPNIYEFLRDEEKIPERAKIAQLIASAKDHTKAIVEATFDPPHPSELFLATVDSLVSILASEASNLALKVLATDRVYLAGGIALHLLKLLQKPQFGQTFTRKDRFKDLMERMPIHIITTSAALVGAATFGLQSLSKLRNREGAKASLAPV